MKMHGFTRVDEDWIGLMIFKNFVGQDWMGFNSSDQDWTWTENLTARSSLVHITT